MSTTILQTGGRVFQKSLASLTEHLSKPTSKFIRDLLCGILFSDDLVLTNLASKVPHNSTITTIAKRFGRHLASPQGSSVRIMTALRCHCGQSGRQCPLRTGAVASKDKILFGICT